jgi:formate C-acetyltransferase
MRPTPRVERLRERYLNTPNKVVIDIGRIVTRVMKETEGEPIVIRRAKAFAATVRGVPTNIFADELLVGWIFSEPRGTEFPVERGYGLEKELDTLSTRDYMPFLISDEDKRELREEILPYWKARGNHTARNFALLPPEVKNSLFVDPNDPSSAGSGIKGFSGVQALRHMAHFTAGYEKVLAKGFLGIQREAEERLAGLDLTEPEDLAKMPFLKGVIIAMEAAAEIGKRFAAAAREMAAEEKEATRKTELMAIAAICDRVPADPARTFREALQSVWFTHILHGWEVSSMGGTSPGRADQYLYPFYENDRTEGRITKEEAQELVDCWFMRHSQYLTLTSLEFAHSAYGHSPGHHIDVGGLKADGSDATNELSYMFIEAMMHTPGMVEPTLGLLVHSRSPDDLLIKGCQLTSLGGGYPMFINDDVIVDNLLSRGTLGGPPVPLDVARRFGSSSGCLEPTVNNMDSGFTQARLNVPQVLEYVLTNGWSRIHQKRMGIETGNPRQFKSFEEVREAFRRQLVWVIKCYAIALNIQEMTLAETDSTVYQSALTEDCIKKGKSKEKGGARYNFGPGITACGAVDVGDSLAAIRKLVFDEKKITMGQLCDALDKDFEGYDQLRRMLLSAPKYGNDDDYADEQVAWVMRVYSDEVLKHKNTRGGHMLSKQIPLSTFIPQGKVVGALPSGRLAGEPLSDGVSPTRGSDTRGPTAVIKSAGKINAAEVSRLGQTLNMRIAPAIFESDAGFKTLADLLRVFIDEKIHHIQINVVSSDTLRAAQRDPGKYNDLVVKVAGYNAYFTTLPKSLQDAIIARTEHGI